MSRSWNKSEPKCLSGLLPQFQAEAAKRTEYQMHCKFNVVICCWFQHCLFHCKWIMKYYWFILELEEERVLGMYFMYYVQHKLTIILFYCFYTFDTTPASEPAVYRIRYFGQGTPRRRIEFSGVFRIEKSMEGEPGGSWHFGRQRPLWGRSANRTRT